MQAIKDALRRFLPHWVLDRYRQARYGRSWFDFEDRSREEVFTHIYRRGIWGRGGEAFYSGPGSEAAVSAPYVQAIREFVAARGIRSIVDLGCGDFRVGAQLVTHGLRYHGVDIVAALIDRNKTMYAQPNVSFSCLDATSSELPAGELCLVREVLQHLSNAEIASVLERCRKFPYVVVTESIAAPESYKTPNIDIVHGPNTRADIGSGVVLDAPPFDEHVTAVLVESPGLGPTVLRSVLIDNTESLADGAGR